MKNYQLIIAGAIVFGIASCKKNNDVQAEQPAVANTAATGSEAPAFSAWKQLGTSAAKNAKGESEYNAVIADEKITADVAAAGLVLVFMKTATGAEQLPFSQKGGVSWYYQVSNGTINITAAAPTGVTVSNDLQLRYVVLSKEQLYTLETNGQSKTDLVNLDYLKAVSLFKSL